ncbi:iron-sulfur cluster assembly scaffold protein [Okibacterium fritillariae]|uniref:Nitrogen fixation protein NifU n=1 Tax=Okibacterium fritillariae TaxID=123320 RepID=A0A1T5IN88_9MICO|nr:iron-sulfur cluster assembly scaffold protein [Okibacterium fritillariae]SKC40512.1 nitrogen fixation protein NifU [Okibacterium fritillariae]
MASPELAGLYQQVILDHSKLRKGSGLVDGGVAESHQLNPTCGDEITLRLHLVEGSGSGLGSDSGNAGTAGDGTHGSASEPIIERLSWDGQGCSISMASASLLSELAPGLTPTELTERIALFREMMRSRGAGVEDDEPLGDAAVLESVSKYIARVKCAMLAWVAAEDTVQQVTAGRA